MGLRHCEKPIYGVQWHPESICSTYGHEIMENFRSIVMNFWNLDPDRLRRRASRLSQTHVLREIGSETIITSKTSHSSEKEAEYRSQVLTTKNAYSVMSVDLDGDLLPEIVFDSLIKNSSQNGEAWLDSAKNRDQHSRYSYLASGIFSLSYSTRSKTVTLFRDGAPKSPISLNVSFWQWFNTFQEEIRCNTQYKPHEEQDHHNKATLQVGFIGYFGYEMKRESLAGYCWSPSDSSAKQAHPDAQFLFAQNVLRFDHQEKKWRLYGLVRLGDSDPIASYTKFESPIVQNKQQLDAYIRSAKALFNSPIFPRKVSETLPKFLSADSMNHYISSISRVRSAIKEGESYEMTLTTEFRAQLNGHDPFNLYRGLRERNPAPYSAFMNFPATEVTILSSSPERFISISGQGAVEMKPIKGTVAVSKNPEQDALQKHHLATDVKELAENLMIVDLIRNDLHGISHASSIKVPKLMQVESYETVHQLVTTIQSQVRPGVGAVQAIQSVFPPGSMTGAPKLRSVQILDTLEQKERGIYSGCLGYFCVSGATDQSVIIRTVVRTGNDLNIGAGGAITWLSNAQKEWEEVLIKARAVADIEIVQRRADSLDPFIRE
ncbi:aminodeoxychorismate synthase, variant 2 [Verruconis gallopava]|nr:aminodeoxychorismate synthase, variant 1 [Verruconis gallopava]XP_016215889.1 aminodeoxychorismate synthase, variant 2 [Verruconis gallopava]KIW06019.1 aminodeoxychorismate synthase, variant 1 [Verruconis gallopava]KIW06020.1 aminodeoxychorismate synthase, variant 2 [Verruconis gallopava]